LKLKLDILYSILEFLDIDKDENDISQNRWKSYSSVVQPYCYSPNVATEPFWLDSADLEVEKVGL
jgi:hypothetical protein